MTDDFDAAMGNLRRTLAEQDRIHQMDTDHLRSLLEVARAEAQASQRVSELRKQKLDQYEYELDAQQKRIQIILDAKDEWIARAGKAEAALAELQERIPVLRFRDDEAREDAERLYQALLGVRAYDGSGLHPSGFDGGDVQCWVDQHSGDACQDEHCVAARDAIAAHEEIRDARPALL